MTACADSRGGEDNDGTGILLDGGSDSGHGQVSAVSVGRGGELSELVEETGVGDSRLGEECGLGPSFALVSASADLCFDSPASIGYLPLAVSPDSITQSAPSRTALATSEISARVGRGLYCSVSPVNQADLRSSTQASEWRRWKLASDVALAIIIFWAMKTWLAGISIPRSPRATMTPSASLRISSKFSTPCSFSILTMILDRGALGAKDLSDVTDVLGLSMKDAKTMSTPFLTPKAKSALSFSERAGRSTGVLGRLTPFRLERVPELRDRTRSFSPSMAMT